MPLLRRFRDRKATDPRGKVYALLSLTQNEHCRSEIVLDYSLSEREVYRRTTLELIYASESLSVLRTDLGRKLRNDLPTWFRIRMPLEDTLIVLELGRSNCTTCDLVSMVRRGQLNQLGIAPSVVKACLLGDW